MRRVDVPLAWIEPFLDDFQREFVGGGEACSARIACRRETDSSTSFASVWQVMNTISVAVYFVRKKRVIQ